MLLTFLACLNSPVQGTAVGNPTGMSVATAAGSDVAFTSGSATVTQVQQGACSGDVVLVQPVGKEISLIAGDLPLTAGDWCTVSLSFGGPILLEGQGTEHRLHLSLQLSELSVPVQMPLQGGYILELGRPGWVDGLSLAAGDLSIQAGSPEHDQLLLELQQSRLYLDTNKNRVIDSEERTGGAASSASTLSVPRMIPEPADSGIIEQESQRQGEDSAESSQDSAGSAPEDSSSDSDEGNNAGGNGNSNAGGNGNGNAYGLDKQDDSGDSADSGD